MPDLAGLASTLARSITEDIPDGAILEAIPEPNHRCAPARHLELLHRFGHCNPIYHTFRKSTLSDIPVQMCKGDFNRYWLGSIRHNASKAPFSPTWLLSAYAAASVIRSMNLLEVVDVGSGDGRIAYSARVCGMKAYSIEIDYDLVSLQKTISGATGVCFRSEQADASAFDYDDLGLRRPAFFIGGLAQMGGAKLAESVLDRIGDVPGLSERSCMVLVGTYSPKYAPAPPAGWGPTIRDRGLKVLASVDLPTAWTMGEKRYTPYLYCGV